MRGNMAAMPIAVQRKSTTRKQTVVGGAAAVTVMAGTQSSV